MEEGVTIAKVTDWMKLKPEMMPHLIREHEKLGRTLTEEETITLSGLIYHNLAAASFSSFVASRPGLGPRPFCASVYGAKFTRWTSLIEESRLVMW